MLRHVIDFDQGYLELSLSKCGNMSQDYERSVFTVRGCESFLNSAPPYLYLIGPSQSFSFWEEAAAVEYS